ALALLMGSDRSARTAGSRAPVRHGDGRGRGSPTRSLRPWPSFHTPRLHPGERTYNFSVRPRKAPGVTASVHRARSLGDLCSTEVERPHASPDDRRQRSSVDVPFTLRVHDNTAPAQPFRRWRALHAHPRTSTRVRKSEDLLHGVVDSFLHPAS